jgi:hypothetical protein
MYYYRTDYGHQECKKITGEDPRVYCILSKELIDDGNGASSDRIPLDQQPLRSLRPYDSDGNGADSRVAGAGNVCGIKTVKVEWVRGDGPGGWKMNELPGTEKIYECDYVFLAMGFLGPQMDIGDQLGAAAFAFGSCPVICVHSCLVLTLALRRSPGERFAVELQSNIRQIQHFRTGRMGRWRLPVRLTILPRSPARPFLCALIIGLLPVQSWAVAGSVGHRRRPRRGA